MVRSSMSASQPLVPARPPSDFGQGKYFASNALSGRVARLMPTVEDPVGETGDPFQVGRRARLGAYPADDDTVLDVRPASQLTAGPVARQLHFSNVGVRTRLEPAVIRTRRETGGV